MTDLRSLTWDELSTRTDAHLDEMKRRNAISDATDEELLLELLSRHELGPTPIHRTFVQPAVEIFVGIGRDHTATVTLFPDGLEVLKGMVPQ